MTRTRQARPFPFRANLHLPRKGEFRSDRLNGLQAIVNAAALARADRALRWHAAKRAGK